MGEGDRVARALKAERAGARHPIPEHVRAESAGLGRGACAPVQRDREPAFRVGKRHVNRFAGASLFVERSLPFDELVVRELDLERPYDRDRHDRDARQRLRRARDALEVVPEDLTVVRQRAERVLTRPDGVGVVLPRPASGLHGNSLSLPSMETMVETPIAAPPPSTEHEGVLRYYELAKRAEWQVRDLPWDDLPPVPEMQGSPARPLALRDHTAVPGGCVCGRDGVAAARRRAPLRGEALLHDDGAGRVAPHGGVAEADRAGGGRDGA